jgi:nitrogenase subunit NifH
MGETPVLKKIAVYGKDGIGKRTLLDGILETAA